MSDLFEDDAPETGGNAPGNAGFTNAASYPYTPFEPCLQFMRFFLGLAAGPG